MKAGGLNSSEDGAVLIASLMMIIALMGVSLLCALVTVGVSAKEPRHIMTLERMLEVKMALMGNLWISGSASGRAAFGSAGFIGDYGEPDSFEPFFPDPNFMGVLLDRKNVSGWKNWAFNPEHKYWAGYRGDRYLILPPDGKSGSPPYPGSYRDGWGTPIEVCFDQDSTLEHTILTIRSLGSDGLEGGIGEYREDIEEMFYWKRPLNLTVVLDLSSLGVPDGTVVDLKLTVIYPFNGSVTTLSKTNAMSINDGSGLELYCFDPVKFPIGYLRLEFVMQSDISMLGGPGGGSLIAVKSLLIPPAPVTGNPAGPSGCHEATVECII